MTTLPRAFGREDISPHPFGTATRLTVPAYTSTFQTVLARADLAYAQSVLTRTHSKGNLGEALALRAFLRSKFEDGGNWISLTPRTGRQGFDHLFVRINPNGSYSFMVGESKYGSSQLGTTQGNVRQMSWKWIHARANKLGDAYINVANQKKVSYRKMPFFNSGLKSYDVIVAGKKVTFWRDSNGNWYFTGNKEQLAVAQKEAAKMGKALKTAEIRARLFRIKKSGDDVIIAIDHVKSGKKSGDVQIVKGKEIVLKGVLSKHISDEELKRQIAEELKKKFPHMKKEEIKELTENLAKKYKNGSLLEQAKSVAKSIAFQSLVAAGVAGGLDLIMQIFTQREVNWKRFGVAVGAAAAGTVFGQITAIGLIKTKVGTTTVRYIARLTRLRTFSLLRNSLAGATGGVVATGITSYGAALMGYASWKDANRDFIAGATGLVGGVATVVATTSLVAKFGTCRTGKLISTLSGAAKNNAILAKLGFGWGKAFGKVVLGGLSVGSAIGINYLIRKGFTAFDNKEKRKYVLLLEEKMQPLWYKVADYRL